MMVRGKPASFFVNRSPIPKIIFRVQNAATYHIPFTSNLNQKVYETISFIFRSWMHRINQLLSFQRTMMTKPWFHNRRALKCLGHAAVEANGQWLNLAKTLDRFATSGSYISNSQGNSYKEHIRKWKFYHGQHLIHD
jgi:hypothetical protein